MIKNNEHDVMTGRVTKAELRHRKLLEKLESIQNNVPDEELSTKINDLQVNIKELITESNRTLGLAYVSIAFAFISIGLSVIFKVISLPNFGYWIIAIAYIFAGILVLYFVKENAEKYKKLKQEKQ